jgi:hypothetical protein
VSEMLETVPVHTSVCFRKSRICRVKEKILKRGKKQTMFNDVSGLRIRDPTAVSLHGSLCSLLSTRLAFVNSYKLLVWGGHRFSIRV